MSPNSPKSFGKSQNEDFYHDIADSKFDYTKDKYDIEEEEEQTALVCDNGEFRDPTFKIYGP